jgi:mono/diheme cytochrome c family protein
MNNRFTTMLLFSLMAGLILNTIAQHSVANAEKAQFEIEGLISPVSPKALTKGLLDKLRVKVTDLNLKNTPSGWPVLTVEFDAGTVSKEAIESAIASIEDPAGHHFQVRKGPPRVEAPLLEEEMDAIAVIPASVPQIPSLENPIPRTSESEALGQTLYRRNCAKCHGLDGGGQGPSAHGFLSNPRKLYVWFNTDSSTDGYLFWYITYGRNDMPPWGLVLSEEERWHLVNYVKSMKQP